MAQFLYEVRHPLNPTVKVLVVVSAADQAQAEGALVLNFGTKADYHAVSADKPYVCVNAQPVVLVDAA